MDHKRLQELINYDPDTGIFIWRTIRRGQAKVGTRAGRIHPSGYRLIMVEGETVRAARLAWFYMTGKMPHKVMDHINGIRDDDRFINLREVSRKLNQQNQRKAMCSNKSGILGVGYRPYIKKKPYQARIRVDGKLIHLGYFENCKKAHEVYLQTKRRLHPGCTI